MSGFLPDASTSPRVLWIVALILLLCGAGSVIYLLRPHRGGVPSAPVPTVQAEADDGSAPEESSAKSSGYVGPQACAACHSERVAEFMQTNHYRTCRIPSPEEMPPGFAPGRGTFVTRFPGLRFEMGRSGNSFTQTSIRETPAGEQRSTASVDLILGAGTADDVYLSWRDDGTMHELPMAWLWTSDEWGASYFDPYGTGDFSRPLTPRCLECHNTWIDYLPGSHNRYRRDGAILGVTCERCHGPGQEHVAFHRTHPEVDLPRAIVHPGLLSRERQIEVCTQCHSNAMTQRGPTFRYRPGEPLDDYYRTLAVAHTEDDHVANQIKYLRQSKCFQHSETLTCITCHDPHRPHGPDDSGSDSCRQCHDPAHCGEQPRLPAPVRDNCVGCHMPQYVKINVNFQTGDDNHVPPIRRYDHRIAVHPTATREVLLDWHRAQSDPESVATASRLTEELVQHYRTQAEVHRGEHRIMAMIADLREAVRIADRLDLREELREAVALQTRLDDLYAEATHHFSQQRFDRAIELLQELRALKPDHAEAHYRLGTLYATRGNSDLAVRHLAAAGEHDPDNPHGHTMLGWLAYLDGEPQQALEHYRKAEEIEPYNGKLNYQIGLALAELGQPAESAKRFERALEIEPQRVDACKALVALLLQQNRLEEAVSTAERTAQAVEPPDPDVYMFVAETCAAARRFQDAIAAAERALKCVPEAGAGIRLQIRRRIQEYRARAD